MTSPDFNLLHELGLALLFTTAFGLIFLVSEVIYNRYKWNPEYTRKIVHIGCGTIAMAIAIVHVHMYTIIALGILFTLLVWYMLKNNLLPSVHSVNRKTYGSVLFPSGVIACVIAGGGNSYGLIFFIPLATMIYSDTLAAVVGVNYPVKTYKVFGHLKSIGGSAAFLISAFLVYIVVIFFFKGNISTGDLLKAILFSIIITIIEAISVRGLDDLTIPLASIAFLYLVMN
jgi:phytol kinase